MRRIILFSTLLLSIGVIAYTLFFSNGHEAEQSSILEQISDDALLLFEIEDFRAWDKELRNGSVLWPEAAELPALSELDQQWIDLDTLIRSINGPISDSTFSLAYSLHPNGQSDLAWMLTLACPESIATQLDSKAKETNYSIQEEKSYDTNLIYRISKEDQVYFGAYHHNVLQLSNSILCIEKHLRINESNILSSEAFTHSRNTKGRQHSAHLHLNWTLFGTSLSRALPGIDDPHLDASLGYWSTADILSESNSLYFNGLIQSPDSQNTWLNKLRAQGKGSASDLYKWLPTNTATYIYHHIRDFRKWYGLEVSTVLDFVDQGSLIAEIGDEMTEIRMLRIKEEGPLFSRLEASGTSDKWMDRPVWYNVNDPGLLKLFDKSSKDSALFHLAQCDNILIISEDQDALKQLLIQVRAGRVLSSDKDFQELQDDLDENSSLLYYFDLSRLAETLDWKKYGAPLKNLDEHKTRLANFQALILQYEPAGEDLFHQNLLLRHNPGSKKESGSIWELVLDAPLRGSIHRHKNHYTGQYEILLQDTTDRIHLIDNLGKIIWTKDLDGPLQGEVTQIDIYKNGKLQMLFSTKKTIYGLDRKGRDLDGFPLSISEGLSGPVAVLDYDKNKKYRILIPTNDGDLLNYGVDGRSIDGWKFEKLDEALIGEIKHFTIGKKDYISTISANGTLRFLQRNGKTRYGGKDLNLTGYLGSAYEIIPGKRIGQSHMIYKNSTGELVKTELKGPSTLIDEYGEIDRRSGLLYRSDAGQFIQFNSKREVQLKLEHDVLDGRVDFVSKDYIGIVDKETELYHLYRSSGELLPSFPAPGAHGLVEDFDGDGQKDIIICDAEGVLYFYSLD